MLVLQKLTECAKTDRVALINRGETLSFTALEQRSNAFAAWLIRSLGEDKTPVVIYGEKETDFLCCIFGALKSGRAYVPIDRTVPAERAEQIIADVSPRVIVNFGGFSPGTEAVVLNSETVNGILSTPPRVANEAEMLKKRWVSGDEYAYILFTSGSTGRPKGVPITAKNIDSFCKGLLRHYPSEDGGVVLHQISYSFDVSGCAVYAGLSRAMTLFTVDHEMAADFGELFEAFKNSNLTLWVSTPSFAEICVRSGIFNVTLLPKLKQFLFCGEVLTHTLCDALSERFPHTDVLNTYGPTEATVLVTAVKITGEMRSDSRAIPIGEPIDGAVLRLVDSDGKEITANEQIGELMILGESVGPGYFGQPHLTEKFFFFDEETGLRGYRSGDLCYRENNLYYYCGRMDNQLKLNGFRVEIEDIESNMESIPNIARAAVLPVWKGEKVDYLAAFVMLQKPDGLSNLTRSIESKRQAAKKLPAYMIPRKIFTVEEFPLNVNGKIDKKALAKRLEETS